MKKWIVLRELHQQSCYGLNWHRIGILISVFSDPLDLQGLFALFDLAFSGLSSATQR